MTRLLLRIALRLALCSAVGWWAWRAGGLVTMVATTPLFGVALARPLLDLASELHHHTRAAVWHSLEGRHYTYRGTPVQVLEDADRQRWVRAEDVRRIVGSSASDHALALTYPDGWRAFGAPPQPHFSADALVAHLLKDSSPQALRLRHWVEREIAFPARRRRERLGIRAPRPGSAPDD